MNVLAPGKLIDSCTFVDSVVRLGRQLAEMDDILVGVDRR